MATEASVSSVGEKGFTGGFADFNGRYVEFGQETKIRQHFKSDMIIVTLSRYSLLC